MNDRPSFIPVGELAHSLDSGLGGVIQRVKPIVDEATLERTIAVSKAFAQTSGKVLQKRLEEYAAAEQQNGNSWMTRLWQQTYLSYRGALSTGLNYLTTLDTSGLAPYASRADLCGALVSGLTQAYLDIARGTLESESNKSGPLCMEQYANIFASCRIPSDGSDEVYNGLREGVDFENAHIIVMLEGNIYVLDVVKDGVTYSSQEISKAISALMERKAPAQPNVGAMTFVDRDSAYSIYKHIRNIDGNQANFKDIHTAVFALCIDEYTESTSFNKLYSYNNRWFDKCIQVIVDQSDEVGFNNEHTSFDAAVWVSTLLKLYARLEAAPEEAGSGTPPSFRMLEWTLDDAALSMISKAQAPQSHGLALKVAHFTDFGSTLMKTVKASPDAFFHIALQLACYRHQGKLSSTYEAVAMRQFHQGRTEAMRPSTSATLNFAKAMSDISVGRDERIVLARTAFALHVDMIGECQRGEAPERHLFGLEAMITDPIPPDEDIFSDPGYNAMRSNVISSSGLGAACMGLFCFAPVNSQGLGVGYIIGSDSIKLGISAFAPRSPELESFAENLHQSLRDLRDLLQ